MKLEEKEEPLNSAIDYSENTIEVCEFFTKTGCCRHWNVCKKLHIEPEISKVIVLKGINRSSMDVRLNEQEVFDDIYLGVSQYGELEDFILCRNLSPHLRGNVYIKYKNINDSSKALKSLNQRRFGGYKVKASFISLNDIRNSQCSQYRDFGYCERGAVCNFIHISNNINIRKFEPRVSENSFNNQLNNYINYNHNYLPYNYVNEQTEYMEYTYLQQQNNNLGYNHK